MSSQLVDDIKLLNDKKSNGEKFRFANVISQKSLENVYTLEEIESFLNIHLLNSNQDQQDYFIKLVVLNLVIYTRNSNGIIRLLKSEDEFYVTRIIKRCEFFWSTFDDTKLDLYDFCENIIFSVISYSNRMQLINTIANQFRNNEEMSEKFFEKFRKNFSLIAAKPFLKYCSEDFILMYLKRGLQLTCKDMLLILSRKSEFIIRYFLILFDMIEKQLKYYQLINIDNFQKVFTKLLKIYPEKILQIFIDYKNLIEMPHVGRKLTKRILLDECSKNVIIKSSKLFISCLSVDTIYKHLNENEYKIFYKNLFPEKMDDFELSEHNEIYKNLNYYKNDNEKKLQLLLETYRRCYENNLLDNLRNFNPELLKLLNMNERIEYVQKLINNLNENCLIRLHKFSNIDELLCYLPCEQSIEKFKKQLQISSDANTRGTYLALMIDTCEINNDTVALLDVLKYYNKRHRNERSNIRMNVLNHLIEVIDLKHLNESHWNEINEMLQLANIYDDLTHLYMNNGYKLFENYLEYNFKNNSSTENIIKLYLKWLNKIYMYEYELFIKKPFYRRKYLNECGKYLKEVRDYAERQSFILTICDWNKKNPNDTLSITDYPWTLEDINVVINKPKNKEYVLNDLLTNLVYDKKASEIYLNKIKEITEPTVDTLQLFLRDNPDAIYRNLNRIFADLLERYNLKSPTLHFIKNDTINGKFKDEFKKYCLNVVNKYGDSDESTSSKIGSAIRVLAYWLNENEFFSLVEKYYPNEERISYDNENSKLLYEIQTSIAYSLKLYKNSSKIFEIIRKFCVGDYLKLIVGILNLVCTKIPYYKAKKFLDSNLDVPVSFKKHIIRLQCLINKRTVTNEFLGNLWKTENNSSIREIILKKIFDTFVTEPSTNTWELFKNCLNVLNFKDQYALGIITDTENVSDDYYSQYIDYCWKLLIRLENENIPNINEFKSKLLNKMKNSINLISEQFIIDLINENLFENNIRNSLQYNYIELSVCFILQASSNSNEQEKHINILNQKIKNLIQNYWNNVDDENLNNIENIQITKKLIIYTFEMLCLNAIKQKDKSKNPHLILINFRDKIYEIFDPTIICYAAFIKMQLAILFIQNNCFKEFGKNLRRLIDNETATYESYIIPYLASIFKEFLQMIDNGHKIREIIDGLLNSPLQSIECALFVINLIDSDDIHKKEYRMILNSLKQNNDKRVQMFLNSV